VRRLFRKPGRGLTSGLVYFSAGGSIAGHRVALTTPNDEHGRAEIVIPAPEKRKVGSSILPLTTTLIRTNADSIIPAAPAC
jgi:hypothetical protein